MPKYDLAGNPLPETGSTPASPLSPSPAMPPQNNARPPASIPESETRYDLAGNALPKSESTMPQFSQPGMGTPQGRPVASQPGGTWPPPSGAVNPYAAAQAQNDSGMKAGVPPEIAALKWNWGAFGLTFLWCLNHRLIVVGVLFFIGSIAVRAIGPAAFIIILIAQIYFGLAGNKLAWRHRNFPGGVPQFFDVQRAWMKWGIGLFCFTMFFVLAAVVFPIFAKARDAARERSGYYQQQGNQQNMPQNSGGQ